MFVGETISHVMFYQTLLNAMYIQESLFESDTFWSLLPITTSHALSIAVQMGWDCMLNSIKTFWLLPRAALPSTADKKLFKMHLLNFYFQFQHQLFSQMFQTWIWLKVATSRSSIMYTNATMIETLFNKFLPFAVSWSHFPGSARWSGKRRPKLPASTDNKSV